MKKHLFTFTILLFAAINSRTAAQAPANDDCQNAIAISITCASSVSATTVNSTPSPQFSTCSTTDNDDDIWYSFIAPSASITVTISNAVLNPSGTANIGMEIYNGPCGDFASVFCDNDIASGSGEQTVTGLTTGSRYLIRFWTTGTASEGSFDFCLQDATVVPVKLVSYSAACNAGHILIVWTTATEVNNDFFTVEKSKDGVQFEPLAIIDAPANASNGKSYSVTDLHPFENNCFYRLKQTDLDGREEYFKIVQVNCRNNGKAITANPNPVSNKLLLTLNNNFRRGKINILSSTGALIRKVDYTIQQNNTVEIDLGNILKGTYLFQIEDNSGKKETIRIVKQ